MEWSAQHLHPATRDRTQERGGREPRHKRFIIWTCQQKRTVWTEHGKVHRFWMCYTNPFTLAETWAGFEVSHSYPFGPIWPCHHSRMVWRCMRSSDPGGGRGELSFHRCSGPCPLTEPVLSPQAGRRVQGRGRGPSVPAKPTFVYRGPQSTQQQAICLLGLLPASNLSLQLWCQLTGCIKRQSSTALLRVKSYRGFCEKEALVGCLTVSKSTHVHFPSPQTTVITEIILHWRSNNLSCIASPHKLGSNIWQLSTW